MGTETIPVQETSGTRLLLVFCDKRHTQTIVEEFTDWNLKEGLEVRILLYGITQKAHDGFVLIELNKSLPEGVYMNMVTDEDIFDYIQYDPQGPVIPLSV